MDQNEKFKILTEGQEFGVKATCEKYAISRTLYYRWMKRYKTSGLNGLSEIKKNFTPINKTDEHIEKDVLKLIRTYPKYGPKAIKFLLEEIGHDISESAVFNIMKRHDLTNRQSRIVYAAKKNIQNSKALPSLGEFSSGECWLFWITDYGYYKELGNLFEYTFFDITSKVSCTRIYPEVKIEYFEELLAAVAIPVSHTMKLRSKYLCFFNDSLLITKSKSKLEKDVLSILHRNDFHIKTYILEESNDMQEMKALQREYTSQLLTFFLSKKNDALDLRSLRKEIARYVRIYNIQEKQQYDDESLTPIEYHNKATNTNTILPLWAYIDREY